MRLMQVGGKGGRRIVASEGRRSWFVGRIKEAPALAKMKPMLSECRVDIAARLPSQGPGEFHLLRDGAVTGFRADFSAVAPDQRSEEAILSLARGTRGEGSGTA